MPRIPFQPTSNSFEVGFMLASARERHAAAAFGTGSVVVSGWANGQPLGSVELWAGMHGGFIPGESYPSRAASTPL